MKQSSKREQNTTHWSSLIPRKLSTERGIMGKNHCCSRFYQSGYPRIVQHYCRWTLKSKRLPGKKNSSSLKLLSKAVSRHVRKVALNMIKYNKPKQEQTVLVPRRNCVKRTKNLEVSRLHWRSQFGIWQTTVLQRSTECDQRKLRNDAIA